MANSMQSWLAPFFMMLMLSVSAFARPKTDVLFMKNGDRITCEVKRLEGNVLEVGLDYVDGSVYIDWEKIDRVESSYLFLVQLTDGSAFAGTVIKSPQSDGQDRLAIQAVDAGRTLDVPQTDVTRMTQTSVSWLQRFNGGVTLGSQYAKGNSTTQYNFSSDVGYEEIEWSVKARYSSNLSSSSGADTATRNQLDFSGYHLARWKNYFYAGSGGYLQSSVQGIEKQLNVGAGIGKFLQNTGRTQFSVLGGLGVQRTDYNDTTVEQRTQNIGVGILSSNLDIFRFKKTRLSATASLIPALTDPGRVFAKANTSYYLKVFGKLDWNFSFYGNWDSRPPEGLQKSDYGTSTGLSYSFGNR